MEKEQAIGQLQTDIQFFRNSTSCFTEDDSGFSPKEEMLSVAEQVAHVAHTIDWFLEGAFSPNGFNLNFEEMHKSIADVTSLYAANTWLENSLTKTIETILLKSDEELSTPLPEGPIMGGLPRYTIFSGITDHTAHHRGALTVYARLLGKKAKMPYESDGV